LGFSPVRFPLKRFIDAAIDLPFAPPTSVGLTLATVYSNNGWIGSAGTIRIKVAFTRLGSDAVYLLAFVVRALQPVCRKWNMKLKKPPGLWELQTFWRVVLPPLMPAL